MKVPINIINQENGSSTSVKRSDDGSEGFLARLKFCEFDSKDKKSIQYPRLGV